MIYLDNSAIERPRNEVIDIVLDVLHNHYYNPNSVYENGLESKRMIIRAKQIIADEIGCNEENLIMCNSGSEANTTALLGIIKHYGYMHFITSTIGHPSVIENPYAKKIITVDKDGRFNMDDISKIHDKFVSLALADSEIGTVQDIKNITKILHKNNNIIHSDFTSAFGKIKINIKDLDVDLATFTSQKIGGILGSACLYVKPGISIEPLIYGHDSLHNGTPNTAAICAFGEAVRLFDWNEIKEIRKKRDYFIDNLLKNKNITLNGSYEYRLPNNINICINGINIDNQQLVTLLDMMRYCVSAGSACNSGSSEPSKTLLAIGLNENDANHSIRITLSNEITYENIDSFVKDLNNIIIQFAII